MLKSVEGIYRQGKVELGEAPTGVKDDTRVIVTFLGSGAIDFGTHGANQDQVAVLRSRLAASIEEWESPEMDVYDDYDRAKAQLWPGFC